MSQSGHVEVGCPERGTGCLYSAGDADEGYGRQRSVSRSFCGKRPPPRGRLRGSTRLSTLPTLSDSVCGMEPHAELSRWPASRHETAPERRVLVLPGKGYTAQLPGIHLPLRVLALQGWQVWTATWHGVEKLDDVEGVEDLVVSACENLVRQARTLPQLVLAKSLGTMAAGWVADHDVPAIWTTPLLNDEVCVRDLARSTAPALMIAGSEDAAWDDTAAATTGLPYVMVPGADHGWQVGDWRSEVAAIHQLCEAVEEFASQLSP